MTISNDEAAEKMAATQAANIRLVAEQIRSGTLEKLPENFAPKVMSGLKILTFF